MIVKETKNHVFYHFDDYENCYFPDYKISKKDNSITFYSNNRIKKKLVNVQFPFSFFLPPFLCLDKKSFLAIESNKIIKYDFDLNMIWERSFSSIDLCFYKKEENKLFLHQIGKGFLVVLDNTTGKECQKILLPHKALHLYRFDSQIFLLETKGSKYFFTNDFFRNNSIQLVDLTKNNPALDFRGFASFVYKQNFVLFLASKNKDFFEIRLFDKHSLLSVGYALNYKTVWKRESLIESTWFYFEEWMKKEEENKELVSLFLKKRNHDSEM